MNKNLRKTAVLIISMLCIQVMFAQPAAPGWITGCFYELNNSYIEVVSATGASQDDCRAKALRQLVERRNLASGAQYDIQLAGGQVVVSGRDALTVKARVIDEYLVRDNIGMWSVYLLVQTCKNPTLDYESVCVSDRYPLASRSFIPGAVQLVKGQNTKAIVIMALEAAAVGGIVAAETLRGSYSSKAAGTHSTVARMDYTDRANFCADVRNICIAGAVAVYVWNVVDAVAAKGPRHLRVGPSVCFGAFEGYTPGLALNINF